MARPPSNQPAVWSMKLTPASMALCNVLAASYAACASGSLEPQSPPPLRNGTPNLRASAAHMKITIDGSGVPKVGAPDCIETALEKVPKITGAPLRVSWVKHIPASASARICVHVPTMVTGDIAPERMNGEITVAWLFSA